jgi:excisionase family DNA binding protein
MSEPYISANEVALALGVKLRTVVTWAQKSQVKCYRIGPRLYRFKLSEVMESIVSKEPKSKKAQVEKKTSATRDMSPDRDNRVPIFKIMRAIKENNENIRRLQNKMTLNIKILEELL